MKNFRDLPILIKAIVIGLIVAPFGNFAATFSALGIPDWYLPNRFIELAMQVSALDWAWNGLLLISGILLLMRRKLAWAFAVFAIFSALGANFYNWYLGTIGNLNPAFFALASLGSLAMLGILFYFRYPHLDRRDRWLSVNHRLPVTVKVEILEPVKIRAMLINVSATGALLEVTDSSIGNFQVNGRMKFTLPTNKTVQGQIVRASAISVAVHFDTPLTTDDLKF